MATKNAKQARNSKKAQRNNDRREIIPSEAKIKLLVTENPHRGKVAHRTFAQYKNGMTVGEWREHVRKVHGDLGYLHGDIRRGQVKVTLPKTTAAH